MKRILLMAIAGLFAFNINAQTTIPDIHGSGDVSPLEGTIVTTSGIVTGIRSGGDPVEIFGFFIQDGEGVRTGIYVYSDLNQDLVIGDDVSVTGEVDEYYEMTELTNVTDITINSSGNTLPNPAVISTLTAGSSEDYEGVLVKVESAECTGLPDTHGIWTINDGSGDGYVDDWMYHMDPDPVVGTDYDITGCLTYDFSQYKICPRSADDIVENVSVSSINKNFNIYPNPATTNLNVKSISNIDNIIITNVIGQRVINVNNIQASNYSVELANLANGVYLITVENTDGTSALAKFVKK